MAKKIKKKLSDFDKALKTILKHEKVKKDKNK